MSETQKITPEHREMWIGRGAPKFGQAIVNQLASMNNPRRSGIFVREFRRPSGSVNPGLMWELTDGNGDFWTMPAIRDRAEGKC